MEEEEDRASSEGKGVGVGHELALWSALRLSELEEGEEALLSEMRVALRSLLEMGVDLLSLLEMEIDLSGTGVDPLSLLGDVLLSL